MKQKEQPAHIGVRGGRIVASGTPEEIAACPESRTGRYL